MAIIQQNVDTGDNEMRAYVDAKLNAAHKEIDTIYQSKMDAYCKQLCQSVSDVLTKLMTKMEANWEASLATLKTDDYGVIIAKPSAIIASENEMR